MRSGLSPTTIRLGGVFAAVLALFGFALVVVLVVLSGLAKVEAEMLHLDHAKHMGHLAASQVREQYIHQAHAIIEAQGGEAREFEDHLEHYDDAAQETHASLLRLMNHVRSPEERATVEQMTLLACESDALFQSSVVPAIMNGDRAQVVTLHRDLEKSVSEVVALNEELNRSLEAASRDVQARAEQLRQSARRLTVICFAIAIVAAALLAVFITRALAHRIGVLEDGARRVASGDLTTRIELPGRDELAGLAASLNHMTAELRANQESVMRSQRLASIGQVAAGVAHEINNPLGVILGYAKLLQRQVTDEQAKDLAIIEQETRQCQRIVEGLLSLARQQRLSCSDVDLVALASDTKSRLEESDRARGKSIVIAAKKPSVVAWGDESKLRQVLDNLVMNALDATPQGATVEVAVAETDDGPRVSVVDRGPGMSPEVLKHAFQPFFTTKDQGTGLGLAISQAIVDAHGGKLQLESAAGRGTTVTVELAPGGRS